MDKTTEVYNYLSSNFDYAFYVDGFMVSIPNRDDMEISLCYMNKAHYDLTQFNLSQGTDLTFDYRFDGNSEIPVLIGKGLSKTYPVGSTIDLAIVGESGAGKSSLLNIIGLLDRNYDGEYTLFGLPTNHSDTSKLAQWRNQKIGFVLQESALINSLTIEDNIKLPFLYAGAGKKGWKEMEDFESITN